ncbi:photosystem II protein, Psb35-related [Egbenema bharatensis]|uniref:photosystem II protein, Psb35-related n=1 Tax=Egbenema bharatensis TaxID=3463334 RepID=UPI003A83B6D6
MITILIALFALGWVAAAVIGTQAYFRGEQTKPIHERNWRSASFEQLAESFTGVETDYNNRVPAYRMDAYSSQMLPDA